MTCRAHARWAPLEFLIVVVAIALVVAAVALTCT